MLSAQDDQFCTHWPILCMQNRRVLTCLVHKGGPVLVGKAKDTKLISVSRPAADINHQVILILSSSDISPGDIVNVNVNHIFI